MRAIKLAVMCVSVLAATAAHTQAGTITIVDQQLLLDDSDRISRLTGIRQSFTPNLTAIDAVEFWIYDPHPDDGFGGVVEVLLYDFQNNVEPLIGTSNAVTLPNGYGNTGNELTSGVLTQFVFPTRIALDPGKVYDFEIQWHTNGGKVQLAVLSSTMDAYEGGTASIGGKPLGRDLFFREGLTSELAAVPEPSSCALFSLGGIGLTFVAARRRAKHATVA